VTEKPGGEAVFLALEAALLDVVVAADAVRQLVPDDVAVGVAWSRPRGDDHWWFFLRDDQLQTSRSARHYITIHVLSRISLSLLSRRTLISWIPYYYFFRTYHIIISYIRLM